MLIEIAGPVFKCSEDENIFFERIYSLPGYEGVVGRGGNLYLTIAEVSGKVALEEIQAICDFWNTTFHIVNE